MILLVTNKNDLTADFLVLEFHKRNKNFVRFNTEDYPEKVKVSWKFTGGKLEGFFSFPGRKILFEEIKSIWYRRPVKPKPPKEIELVEDREFIIVESDEVLQGIWRCLDVFWVSNPDALKKAEYKLFQLKKANELGFRIPPTIVSNLPKDILAFYEEQNREIIYKPMKYSRVFHQDSIGLIYTNKIRNIDITKIENVKYSPALFQKYIPKDIEIRVTVIGNKVFAAEIHSQEYLLSTHDWRKGNELNLMHRLHYLPKEINDLCVKLVQSLSLNFGAIDLILQPNGEYVFLEINPNGQWAWLQQENPDIKLREALTDLLLDHGNEKNY